MNMALAEKDINRHGAESISGAKAYRLFWLGRYAERVYMSLHLLRKYYDADIDGAHSPYELYCEKLHIPFDDGAPAAYITHLLYGKDIQNSLLSGLSLANDNALVLRGELTSETLSYIQMALCHMQASAEMCETNVTELQTITDNLLAFWGSADERILNATVKDFLHFGRFLERLDLEIRFGYDRNRIIKTFFNMRKATQKLSKACDESLMAELDALMIGKAALEKSSATDAKILALLCGALKI